MKKSGGLDGWIAKESEKEIERRDGGEVGEAGEDSKARSAQCPRRLAHASRKRRRPTASWVRRRGWRRGGYEVLLALLNGVSACACD